MHLGWNRGQDAVLHPASCVLCATDSRVGHKVGQNMHYMSC